MRNWPFTAKYLFIIPLLSRNFLHWDQMFGIYAADTLLSPPISIPLRNMVPKILSRQISIFTHDCQIWLPPAKVGRIGVALNACHTTLYSPSVIPFCAPSPSPHLNRNISSMLGCPREACRSVGGAGQGGVLSAHCNRTCDLTKLEMSASRSAFVIYTRCVLAVRCLFYPSMPGARREQLW